MGTEKATLATTTGGYYTSSPQDASASTEFLLGRFSALVEEPDRVRDSVFGSGASVEFRMPDPSFAGHLDVVCCLTIEGDEFRVGRALCPSNQHTFLDTLAAYNRAAAFIQKAGLLPAGSRK